MATSDERTPPRDSNEYETPREFFDRLHAEFNFTLDAFASDQNAKCEAYLCEVGMNAFDIEWGICGAVFANPPYSSNILGRAVARMAEQSEVQRAVVVGLIPPNTGTNWWHEIVMRRASEVRLLRGRLAFEYRGVPLKGNRYDSCLVIFRPGIHGPQFTSMEASGRCPKRSS